MMKNLLTFASVAKKTTQLLSTVARLRLLLVMLLTLCVSAAWGEDIIFTPSSDKGSVTTNGTTDTGDQVTKSGFTITSSNGVMGNGSNYRVYTGGTLSITSTVGNITAISFTFSSDKYTGGLDNSYTGLSTASWSASATSQARITNITITYTPTSTTKYTVTLVPGSGSVTNTELEEPNAGEGVSLPTPTLTGCDEWTFAGWAEASVGTETTTKPTLIAAGTYKPASNITLYAVYQRTEETEGNGGTENVSRSYTFSEYTAGAQYAEGEEHELDDVLTLTTTQCHFTSELRIYSSDTHNGYVVSNQLPGRIISIGFNAGNNADNIAVFGSTDGTTWTEVGQVKVQSTYTDYTLEFGETNYTYFKLDVVGTKQIRLKSITITWESTTAGGSTTTTYYHSVPDCATETLPSLTASVSSLAFDNVTVNQSSQKTFTLSGSNLTADATLALSGTNAGMFSVSPISVPQSSGSITNETITVTYTPTAKASHSAILTISSPGAEPPIQISLSGTGVAQTADYTVNHYQQNITDDNYTLKETETPSGEVGTSVTPAVKSYTGFTAPSTQTVTIKADGKTVVEYYYTRNSYTLTWDVNEGNDLTGEYTSGSVKYGATITKPADPTREEHRFNGWHNGTAIVTPTTMPAGNVTFTAQWIEIYTIIFNSNGVEHSKVVIDAGGEVTLPSNPTTCDDEKYPYFYGWTETPIMGIGTECPDDLIIANFTPDGTMTLHAVFVDQLPQAGGWQVVKSTSELVAGKIYTIGSYGSPNSGLAMGEQKSDNRAAVSWTTGTPVELTLGGTTGAWTFFDAAYNDGEGGYLYAASNTSNYLRTRAAQGDANAQWSIAINSSNYKATITATGDKECNKIRKNSNSAIFSCYASGQDDIQLLTRTLGTQPTVYITSCCETPAPTNGAYENITGSDNTMSVTLTWEGSASRYHITGGNLNAEGEYTDQISHTISGLTECNEYTFYVSAYPADGCESSAIEIGVTPYIQKTVTFDDGTTTTTQTTSCTSKTVIVPTPTAQNCSTYVWKDEATGTEYTDGQTITPANDMTIVAKWSVETYTITFNDWDGTQLQQSTVECGQTPAYNGETPTRPENNTHQYTFAGWTPTIVPANSDATYTATYTQTQHQITVTWMVNGEEYTLGNPSTTVSAGEQVAKLPTPPSPDDYCGQVFAGWTDQPINSAPIADAPDVLFNTPEASPTLYKEGDKTTVTFYAVFADIKE